MIFMKRYEWVVDHQEIGESSKTVSISIHPEDESDAEYNGLKLEMSKEDARQFTVGTKVKIEVEVYG